MPARTASTPRVRGSADDAGQLLPLHLPAPVPLAGRISPEEAVPCSDAFDNPAWRFSVDWEGARALLIAAEDGTVTLQASNLSDLTPRFPELRTAGRIVQRRPAVLDGVIAVLDATGRPNLRALGSRIAGPPQHARVAPAVFLATDVLYADGAPVLRWPMDRRLAALGAMIESDSAVQVPDHVPARGIALAEAAQLRGLAAVLARRGDAAYHPGVASPARLRVELRPRATCVVVGVEAGRRTPFGRVLLAEYAAGTLVISGRADIPPDLAHEQWLRRTITPLLAPTATAHGVTGHGVRWLQPRLCASVAYTRRHADGRIADAQLLALRDDLDAAWCVRRPPLDPPQLETGGAFLPTVLMPLPLEDSLLLPRQRS